MNGLQHRIGNAIEKSKIKRITMKQKIIAISFYFILYNVISFGQQTFLKDWDALEINQSDLNIKVDSIFAQLNYKSPGCALTIIQNGKLLIKNSYGSANIENEVKFTHESIVRLPYSEGREFIAIAAVLMEKDGVLSLNDKVRDYFPNLPGWAASVTIWDLLNHRSGFVDEWATLLLMYNSMSNRFETEQFLRLLYNQPSPEIEPGKGYMYCNSDFGLLRLIMEKASGNNLPDWIKQRIFEPLKMNSTTMQKSPLEIIPNKANMYEDSNEGIIQNANVQKTSPGGDYYILTSANDLEQWSMAFENIDSEINQAVNKLIESVRLIPGKENHYIVGYSYYNIANQQVIAHEGVNGYNYITRIPSKGLTVITLGNRTGDGFAEENKAIINYLLNQSNPPLPTLLTKPINLPISELMKYIGNYRWQNQVSWEGMNPTRKFSSIYIEDDKLKMRYQGNYVIELTPVGKNVFYYQEGYGVQFEFILASKDSSTILKVTYDDGFPGVIMVKDSETVWHPSKEILAEFTGRFYSKHLDYYWNIKQNEDGTLVLKSSNLPDTKLEPDGYNQFHFISESYPGSGFARWILFNKNDHGEITHLTAWSGRVMHHRFDKE